MISDSLDNYVLGSAFLKDHYSVYDMDNFKMAIGPVFDFDAPQTNGEVAPVEPSTKE